MTQSLYKYSKSRRVVIIAMITAISLFTLGLYPILKARAAAPTAPSNPALTSIPDLRLKLTWQDNSSDENSFKVERSPDDTAHFAHRGSADINMTEYIDDNDLSEARVYYYRVASCTGYLFSDCSAFTSAVSIRTLLIAPQYLYVTQPSASINRLSWTDASKVESNYVIERRLGSGSWSTIATLSANSNSYDDTSITQGQSYTYRVKATSSTANSDYSNAASPGPPKNLPNPTPVGLIPCLSNLNGYAVQDNKLFVANSDIGLAAYDVSNPDNISPLGTQHPIANNTNVYYAKVDTLNNIAVYTLYRTLGTKLFVMDISDPGYIKKLSEITTSRDSARDVTLSGNYAYTSGDPIKVIDLNDPANPQTVKTITAGSSEVAYNVIALNNRLFYITSRGFGIVDITDPLNPVKLSYNTIETVNYIRAFAVQGNTAVFLTSAQIKVFDISNPVSPIAQGTLSFSSPSGLYTYNLVLRNNFIYTIDNQSRLNAINLSDPLSPAISGQINISSLHPFAFLNDQRLLVGTALINVSNPASMTSQSVDNCYSINSMSSVVTNGRVAVADDKVIDVSNIYNPRVVSQLAYTNFVNSTFKDDYFYALVNRKGDYSVRYLIAVNFTNPVSPVVYEYRIPYVFFFNNLQVSQTENLAVVEIGVRPPFPKELYSRVDLLDISDPSQVTVIGPVAQGGDGTTPNYVFVPLLVHNRTVYINDRNESLKIYDVAAPASPQLLTTYPIKTAFTGRVHNNLLYVAHESDEYVSGGSISYGHVRDYFGALRILDISDRANPQMISQYVPRDTYPVVSPYNLYFIDDFAVMVKAAYYQCTIITTRPCALNTIDVSTPANPIYSPYNFDGTYLSPGFTIKISRYLITINSIYSQPQITKFADKTSARSGEEITYSLTAANPTAASFTALSLTDPVPTGASYVAGSAILNGTPVTDAPDSDAYTLLNGVPTWSISSLLPSGQPGSTATASFKVRVN